MYTLRARLGLTLLTGPSSVMMLLMSLTWLVAQENSLLVVGVQYLSRDISRLITKKPVDFSPASRPVVGVLGTCVGYAYMVFYVPNSTSMLVFILLTIAGVIFIYRRTISMTAPLISTLLVAVVYSLFSLICFGDDGGIRENGGWSSVAQEPWLRDELVRRGLPASTSASIGGFYISVSKPKGESKLGWHVAYLDKSAQTKDATTHMQVTDGIELDPERIGREPTTTRGETDTSSIDADVGASNAAVDAAMDSVKVDAQSGEIIPEYRQDFNKPVFTEPTYDSLKPEIIDTNNNLTNTDDTGATVHDDGHITGSVEDIITRWPSGDQPTVSFEMG